MTTPTDPPPDLRDAPSGATARALTELTRDLRATRPPELDMERLERELFAKIDAERSHIAPAKRWRTPAVVAFGALSAAAAALLVAHGMTAPAEPVVSPVPAAVVAATDTPSTNDIATADAPRRFEHPGLAAWTIAAHSHARVTETSSVVTVALQDGAIDVDVIPQPVAERFVVIVDHTRVAVHGTRFRVARTATGVDVDVAHGTVAVGPVDGAGQAPRFLLPGPVGGSFALSGSEGTLRTLRPFGDLRVAVDDQPAPAKPKSPVMKTPPVAKTDAPLPVVMTEVTLGARAQDAAARCFEKNAQLSPGVHLTVETTLTLTADASGSLSSTFDPPLAPPVESCFRDAMAKLDAPVGSFEIGLHLADGH